METKPWWQSTGVWGSILTIYAMVANFFGWPELADPDSLVDLIIEAVTAISAVVGPFVALWGRIRAKAVVTLS